ncbi:hypothetical protein ACR3K2_33070 [Cryptosporidium serpentis]
MLIAFYTFQIIDSEILNVSGVSKLSKLSQNIISTGKNFPQIAISTLYSSQFDSEKLRQDVLNTIIHHIELMNPIRFEYICPIPIYNLNVSWQISIHLNLIFISVFNHLTFPFRVRQFLSIIVNWCENRFDIIGHLYSDEIQVILHVFAPAGYIQLMNIHMANWIENMVTDGLDKKNIK